MMTTSDTVILVTPPSTAAAPTVAYRPEVIQFSPAVHSLLNTHLERQIRYRRVRHRMQTDTQQSYPAVHSLLNTHLDRGSGTDGSDTDYRQTNSSSPRPYTRC